MPKSKLSLPQAVLAASAIVAAVAWSQHRASPTDSLKPVTLDATVVTNRAQIAAVRAEVRASLPARAVVLPANPPPPGIPAWSTRLPNQPDTGTPTPGGAR